MRSGPPCCRIAVGPFVVLVKGAQRGAVRSQELTQMQHPEPVARRLFELTEPICAGQLLLRGAQRRDGGARLPRLLGRLLRGTVRATGPGPGRGRPRGVLQLRRRRGGPAHPQGLEHDNARGGARRARAGLRRRRCGGSSASSSRRPGSHARPSCWPQASISAPTEGRVMYAGLRSLADARGAGGSALVRRQHAARAPRRRPHRRPGVGADRRHRGARAQRPRRRRSTRRSRSGGSTTCRRPGWPR